MVLMRRNDCVTTPTQEIQNKSGLHLPRGGLDFIYLGEVLETHKAVVGLRYSVNNYWSGVHYRLSGPKKIRTSFTSGRSGLHRSGILRGHSGILRQAAIRRLSGSYQAVEATNRYLPHEPHPSIQSSHCMEQRLRNAFLLGVTL